MQGGIVPRWGSARPVPRTAGGGPGRCGSGSRPIGADRDGDAAGDTESSKFSALSGQDWGPALACGAGTGMLLEGAGGALGAAVAVVAACFSWKACRAPL